ncbi:MAG: LysR family transcriptional regulator [Deltaproteobacteria bacterium]|jgi:DNA-binding transcriptional LysR family regulator|nr:LysR family transcriptional regulator [Deltaproteobacteria bacterium]MBW2482277.1 LysR family transcriptional regulator [Deltaproteobacteria bacterium]
MNIDILRTFLSVARTRNFTKSAEENFCTQSTASLRIQSLEEYFGLKLFDRIGKTVYLTTAGELLLPYIKLVVETFDQTNEVVLDIKNLAVGKIALISSQTPGTYIIPPILLDFHKRYPAIKISSYVAYSKIVFGHIAEGNDYDLGIISQPEAMIDKYRQMNIEIKAITDDPLGIIVGTGHPWANKKEIEISELVDSTMFISNQATTLISYLHHLTGKTIKEENTIIMGNLESVKVAVQSNDGFAILSDFIVREELASDVVRRLRLKGYKLKRKIYFIYKKNKKFSPPMEKFVESFMKAVKTRDS